MEKHSMNVNAYRTETSFTTKGELVSTVELIVPAEEVQILREMHSLQEIRPVAYLLSVAHRETGEHRELNLHSKGSKMKDFVPVVILTKRAESSDDLNSLFDASTFELTLNVEVAKDEAPLYDEQEGEQPDTVNAGVLNAPKTTLALPSGDIQDAEFFDVQAFLEGLNVAQLNELLTALDFWVIPDQPNAMELGSAWTRLKDNWAKLEGTDLLAQIKAEVKARKDTGGDAA